DGRGDGRADAGRPVPGQRQWTGSRSDDRDRFTRRPPIHAPHPAVEGAPLPRASGDAVPRLGRDTRPSRARIRRSVLCGGRDSDRAGDAGAAYAAVAVRVLGKVLLVVVLGEVEVGGLGHFGGDGAVAGFGEDLLVGVAGGFGGLLLGVGAVEDRRAVLGADVVALAHALGGVVGLPEDAEQFFVGDFRRVVDDADGFGVARQAAADFLVGGVRGVAALVA